MSDKETKEAHEKLNAELTDPVARNAYRAIYDDHRASFLPRSLACMLIFFGNVVYGKEPSYLKFRAIEVIARVPYQSWTAVSYTLLTLFYANEKRALRYSQETKYTRLAEDNETMHVVVISQLGKDKERRARIVRFTIIPLLFAFLYFWLSYLLFLIAPRKSYELNYLFEDHAVRQYERFLSMHETALKEKKVESAFLEWYGRHPKDEYEFFSSIRNDELIHRNTSLDTIKRLQHK